MKVIIIDDELYARRAIEHKIKENCPELEIVAIAENGFQGYEAIMTHQPDLIFLDIAMPQESGFDMLRRFDHINFEIIFVTGFDKYAMHAIEFSAMGYILKPIDNEKLKKAVEYAKTHIELKKENIKIQYLLANINNDFSQEQMIAIPSMDSIEFIKTSDIVRFEGMEKMTEVHLLENKKLLSSYNIGKFRNLLKDYRFYSPHKSHFINLDLIKKYLKQGTIIMEDGSEVPVSKRRKAEFMEILKTL